MSACLWCEHASKPGDYGDGWCDDKCACLRCGARHEFDGELVGEDWKGGAQLLSVGRYDLRADNEESTDAMLRDVLTRVADLFEGIDSPLGRDAKAALAALGGAS